MIAFVFFGLVCGLRLQDASASQLKLKGAGIDDVIKLLKEMLTNFNDQDKEDKENWEKYSKWSEDEETDRKAFIQNQEGVVMSSTAQLNANQQASQTLTGQLAELATEIAEIEGSIKELVQLRTDEHKAHADDLADLTKTIEATNKAVEVLEGHYAASGAAFTAIKQRVTASLSALALTGRVSAPQDKLQALLQNPDWLATDGGAAYGEYKGVAAESGGVVGTLKSIRATLLDNKQDSIEKENEARRQYESAKAAKESDLHRNVEEQKAKQNALEEAQAQIEHHTATIAQAQADIQDATEYVKVLVLDREHFLSEFNKRSQMRSQENTATQAALDALQEVTVSFLQASTFSTAGLVSCPKCSQAVRDLLSMGRKDRSAALVQLGTAMESSLRGSTKQPQGFFDPQAMAPVTNLLKQLIGKLEDELAAETSHHEWCETEKATSAAAKVEREKNIEELSAEIEQLGTKIEQLTSSIAFLAAELVRVQTETETAVQLRAQEKETYSTARKEHETVIGALEKAMSALSQYALVQKSVAHHKTHLALVQTRSGNAPGFSDYASGSAAGGSAVEMLQDLLNRYSTALNGLIQAEEQAVAAHEQLLARNEQFRKDTTQTKQAKEMEKRQATERLGNARLELADNRKQLEQVNVYIADLKPSCDDIRSTFEERKKRREAEIAALKETLSVLEDPSMMR